ncbi:MAG TPA: FapA family protein [Oligoflexia bacterium]|nr:FapA family protein [Oligoflexia bacterium]HMP49254.1 FapA family protein [Oligoflexia bacterium]
MENLPANSSDPLYKHLLYGVNIILEIVEQGVKAFVTLERASLSEEVPWEQFEAEFCAWIECYVAVENTDSRSINEALSIIKKNKIARRRKIAEGSGPSRGRDGRLVLLVKPYTGSFDGTYNPSEKLQKLFDNIEAGTIVGRIYPPAKGMSGLTVKNEQIPAESGAEINVVIGGELEIRKSDKSYLEIVAKDQGYLLRKGLDLSLQQEFVVGRDINHKTGSIDFIGSVQVKGGVKDGFLVRGKRGVTILGDVDNAHIKSEDGPVIIKGKVVGRDSVEHFSPLDLKTDDLRSIESGDSVEIDSITGQSIFAAKNIQIARFASRSLISAAGIIRIGGSLAASRARVVCGLEASVLGNDSEVKTFIELLSLKEASHEYLSKKQALEGLLQEEESIILFLGPFLSSDKKSLKITDSHRKKVQAVLERLKEVKRRIEVLKESIDRLLAEPVTTKVSQVAILKECFPGVLIRAGDKEFTVVERIFGPCSIVFNWETGQFSKEEIMTLSCEFNE